METKLIKISELKPHNKNPRYIKPDKLKDLADSMEDFEKMLWIRPVVVNSKMEILGGEMKWRAAKLKGMKEIPVHVADNLTKQEEEKFVLKDNIHSGEWDNKLLDDWDIDLLIKMGLRTIPEESFEDRFNSIKDSDAVMPIVPQPDEKHELFIIVSNSQINSNTLRELLGMHKMQSFKNSEIAKSNVISIEDAIKSIRSL